MPSGAALFWWVRLRTWRRAARDLLHAPLKLGVIATVWTILVAGLFLIAHRGIRFIYDTAGLGPFLLSRLWFLFLFVIFLLLIVSQCTGVYATVVRSPETQWWMTLPVSARSLSRAKWLESSLYSAWAVVMLVIPLLAADLVVLRQPWWMALWTLSALVIPLLAIATAVATLLFFGWLRWCGWIAIRREAVPAALVLACGALFWLLGERHVPAQREDAWFLALQGLLPRMKMATAPWLPSAWAARGLDAAVNGRWTGALIYAVLLWTTAVACWRLLDHAAAVVLMPLLRRYAAAPEMAARANPRGAAPRAGIAMRWWMRHAWSAAIAKDALLVLRDPLQWSQAVVFFGLLGVYFANIHRLAYMSVEPTWRIGVAALNLACTLLVLGSLTVRFLFPQMSLEGRSLWLLRIAPNGMRRLLLAKLWLYGVLGAVIIEGLLALSMSRLEIAMPIRWWMAAVGGSAALTLVCLSVGLGAWWIDPGAQDAARLISSSTGALVLVLMLGYVSGVVAALLLAWNGWSNHHLGTLVLASAGFAGLSLLASVVPMRRGLATLEQLEWRA
ncbi:MAG: hypothetical protein HY737_08430 [Candidatus Omnitrophica bacterium]|nr:hypothetical protein [Candidatus Omnitrophota bacterium]